MSLIIAALRALVPLLVEPLRAVERHVVREIIG